MKTLYLIRHAKSSWDDSSQSDFDRPLNKRGEHDAPIMAKFLNKNKLKPGLFLSSPATRAITTAHLFAQEFNYPTNKIISDDRIYEAGIRELMTVVSEIDEKIQTVFLFGHNPGLISLTNLLGDKSIPGMPTCAIAGLEFDVSTWVHVQKHSGKIILFDYPTKHSK